MEVEVNNFCEGDGLISFSLSDEDFFLAAQNNDLGLIKRYISNNWNLNSKNIDGINALMYASWNGAYEAASLLIEKGVLISEKNNDGNTALIYSSLFGYSKIVKLLLENKDDPNVENYDGNTALSYAVFNKNHEVINLLTEYGAGIFYIHGFVPPSLFLCYLKIKSVADLVLNIVFKEEFKTYIPEEYKQFIPEYISLGKYSERRDALIVKEMIRRGYTQADALTLVRICNIRLDNLTICR